MDLLFNETTFSSVFWTALTFGILMAVLGVFAWPRILHALEERERRIQGEIQRAEDLRKEAEGVLARYHEQLEHARVDAQKILEEGRRDAEALRQHFVTEERREAESIRKAAYRDIEMARDKALEVLHHETVRLSLAIASRLIEKNLTESDHRELIEKALAEARKTAEASGL